MKKSFKKALAISILSIGVLSSAPSAFCIGNEMLEYCYASIVAPYIKNKKALEKLSIVNKKYGSIVDGLKRNPYAMSSRSDLVKKSPIRIARHNKVNPPLEGIETFEDTHKLWPKEKKSNQVNKFIGNIETLIYHPQSFDAKRFHYILKINGIEKDLINATEIKGLKDDKNNEKDILIGERWTRSIYAFNGTNYRVEYTKKLEGKEEINKRIVFLFSPTYLFNEYSKHSLGRIVGKNAFSAFDDIMEDFGLKGLFNTDFSTLEKYGFQTGVDTIESDVFRGCQNIKKISIPIGVKKIKAHAFDRCTILEGTEIPDGVTEIGECAFAECEHLKKINIPESVEKIKMGAFNGCTALKEISIPKNVESIEDYSFGRCTSLEIVEIPDDANIKCIGKNAFNGCVALKEINIPKIVKSIGTFAFHRCEAFKEVTIPNSVESIGDFAFDGCKSLEKVNLPERMESIGTHAFNGCKALKKIKISEGVKLICSCAFRGCESLEEITIPDSVTEIEEGAISECTSLKKIIIPNSVKKIHRNVFNGCASLETITYNGRDYHSVREFLDDFKALDGNSLTVY